MFDKLLEASSFVADNWDTITASTLIVVASFDKVAIITLKTVRNVMDAWKDTFQPPKPMF